MTELKLEERVCFISYFMAHVSLGPTFHLSSSEHQRYFGNLSQRVKDQFPHLSCAWPHNQVGNKMSAVSVVYRFQEISLKIRSVPLQGLLEIIFCSCPPQVYGEQLEFNNHLGAWLRRTEWQSKTGKAFCHPEPSILKRFLLLGFVVWVYDILFIVLGYLFCLGGLFFVFLLRAAVSNSISRSC